ncbi:MAG: prepilin-type N-terminal cleavage/methylation domain-containing protein [Acidobacteria bacterium]|nr:prepilin-type N-terminal cleavage/methylation domain-containing protein [Acidobacteriota bacterium]
METNTRTSRSTAGFSLIEVVIALVILMIALLGVFSVFTYAIVHNAGNKSRAQAVQVMQGAVERLRAARFNNAETDPILLGGVKPTETVTTPDGFSYSVNITVDNEPAVGGLQDETYTCLSPQGDAIDCTLKEIDVVVTPDALSGLNNDWRVAVPARIIMRRVRGN